MHANDRLPVKNTTKDDSRKYFSCALSAARTNQYIRVCTMNAPFEHTRQTSGHIGYDTGSFAVLRISVTSLTYTRVVPPAIGTYDLVQLGSIYLFITVVRFRFNIN